MLMQSMQDGVTFRDKSQRMIVRMKWTRFRVKQGGTAGYYPVPA